MKNFKSLVFAAVLSTSVLSFASEATVTTTTPEAAATVPAVATPATEVKASWTTNISEKATAAYTATKNVVVYPFVKANEGCNFVNGKLGLTTTETGYVATLKNNASQIVVVSTAVALAAYATYAYVTKTDKKAKN